MKKREKKTPNIAKTIGKSRKQNKTLKKTLQKLRENIEKRRKYCENIVFIANTSNQGAEIRKSAKKTGPEKRTFSYYNPFEKM